jgi:hypothetical protein
MMSSVRDEVSTGGGSDRVITLKESNKLAWGSRPRNYEAGSPKVDLKVGQYPTMYTSLAFAG